MKYYFGTTGWDDSTCIEPCPIKEGIMIGSIACQNCEHCISKSNSCELTGNIDWIECKILNNQDSEESKQSTEIWEIQACIYLSFLKSSLPTH